MGVERDPGDTTASVSPARRHSSTRVAQYVAATSASAARADGGVSFVGSGIVGCVALDRRATVREPTVRSVSDPNGTARSSVVLLHGFTQTGACFGPLADALATSHTVIRPDLPGHGDATGLSGLDLWDTASHLASAIGPTLETPSVWIGYSMGGRVALHVALAHPELVSGVVLIGTTAGIEHADERSIRARKDRELADHICDVGVEAFLDEWLASPLFAGLPDWARFDHERRRNTADGLAGSLRHAGTGSMEPLWSRLSEIEVPVSCLTGARDEKFTEIGERLTAGLGHAHLTVIADAGHAVHLERPDEVAGDVLPFCAHLAPRPTARSTSPGPRWYAPPGFRS